MQSRKSALSQLPLQLLLRTEIWRDTAKVVALEKENIHNTGSHEELELPELMKNGVFWDVTPCGSSKDRRFGGT
jgi:hypothetical protein